MFEQTGISAEVIEEAVGGAPAALTFMDFHTLLASSAELDLRRLAAVGLTGAHAMDGTLESLERLRELESRDDLVTRILLPFRIEPDTPEEMWEAHAAAGSEHGRR